jgi:hypothetical protein
MPPTTDKRVVTSAIQDMTVTEVRRDLDALRKYWSFCETNRSDIDPAHRLFTEKYDIQTFCFKFIMGHHMKRHNKSSKRHPRSISPSDPQ